MIRSNSSQKRLGISGRVDTEGMVSDYWDMNSSQASNQLENIGRFATENNDLEFNDSQNNLDSQVMVITDPINRAPQILNKQGSVLSQILDVEREVTTEEKEVDQNDNFLEEIEGNFNLERSTTEVKGTHDLLTAKQNTSLN